MAFLNAKGLYSTLNLHDASGVNDWDAKFPELVKYLGLPADSKTVPMNLVNATVAYAVEDIVLGDLIRNKHVSFWWIDWQQVGSRSATKRCAAAERTPLFHAWTCSEPSNRRKQFAH